jgi:uncharacterized protein
MMARLSLRPPTVEVRHTGTSKGLAVYALRSLGAGEHVETCPVILFTEDDYGALPKAIRERLFNWSALISKPRRQHALALGYGSVYNHANPANLTYSALRSNSTLTFIAARAIGIGEELTINYDERSGTDPFDESAWMKRNAIKPL